MDEAGFVWLSLAVSGIFCASQKLHIIAIYRRKSTAFCEVPLEKPPFTRSVKSCISGAVPLDDTELLGKYGRMRLAYLKNQRPVLYNQMLLNGTLWPHLQEVQRAASEQVERTIAALADKFPAPDEARAQLLWVAHMNELKAQAEEVVVREVVYAE